MIPPSFVALWFPTVSFVIALVLLGVRLPAAVTGLAFFWKVKVFAMCWKFLPMCFEVAGFTGCTRAVRHGTFVLMLLPVLLAKEVVQVVEFLPTDNVVRAFVEAGVRVAGRFHCDARCLATLFVCLSD
jgi:hypothetical protein